ncbi:3-hydroxy-9,10-secoandrosta-1,3,5(10)-triene-9,17-dione monooxygenase oxygenase subunit [Nocardia seriolae]|uniref:3-hydroxy-9,10-secoandrosta-1,3,5(10)-triene-9, 17-dione monooxygenase oxygenase subunit n=1 Tax=Nocardia seriolae TaxID=37332 RepID=UPI00051A19B4|nr:3-hydroxy-9,10-secoandrosta-1,3,5(10)-triene-9,17-dione monooxygenase oxygenase subunit [Nocardia seriolae]MTJ64154.1 flavin-dependent monooxygenase [Nocardia seriolae]MTJ72920.1 flavin-dependent monooxygenase [Nocardia seriolae]MTJ88068.1 flavin-dependent monooxygenase [Nocardia seriolae]MTK32058.1 flavin-dependent monooxygenase [Nocardia seriolae]MTK42040.1 flavin-dependent monooxygenase [Nocardia seriolae]
MTHDITERGAALLPSLRERAQETEDLRRIPDASIKDLQESGFFTLLQPRQWGGRACDPVVCYDTVRTLASACGATGWVAGILGIHNWHLGLFDQRAQQDVWGADPNARVASSYAPMGSGVEVAGGYRVSGAWAWSSGCDHADWVVVGGPVLREGKPVDFGSFLIPRTDYRIDDVWHVVGLRGTGSNTVVLDEIFVPEHRFLSFRTMGELKSPGLRVNTDPVYRMPWGTIHPTTISTPIVGMAYGALAAHLEHQGARVRAAYAGERATDDPFGKIRIAEAASDIDAAWRQLSGNVAAEYACLVAGLDVPLTLRATARRDQVRSTARATASLDRLFEAAGAGALVDGTALQRFWRDAHAGRVHAANDAERAYVMYGSHVFGLPLGDTMV